MSARRLAAWQTSRVHPHQLIPTPRSTRPQQPWAGTDGTPPKVAVISQQLEDALLRKGWTIQQAAQQAGVDRSFLSRLVGGRVPPKTKTGRKVATHDARYRRVAEALDLDGDAFIEDVVRLQRGESPVASNVSTALFHIAWEAAKDKSPPAELKSIKSTLVSLLSKLISDSTNTSRAYELKKIILDGFPKPMTPWQADLTLSKHSLYPDHQQLYYRGARPLESSSGDLALALQDEDFAAQQEHNEHLATDNLQSLASHGPFGDSDYDLAALFDQIGDALINNPVPTVQADLPQSVDIRLRVQVASVFYALASRIITSLDKVSDLVGG